MKKIIFTSWCVLATFLLFNACNNGQKNASKSNPLVGSTWMANSTETDTLRDSVFIFTADVVVKFIDDTTGVMFSDNRVFMNSRPELAEDPLRIPFTYSFEKNEGKLSLDFGEQKEKLGQSRYVENTFKYDKKENTISTFAPNKKALNVFSEVK